MTYNEWWNNVASAMQPLPDEDIEEFAHRMTALAWVNGENSERDAIAKMLETTDLGGLKDQPAIQDWVALMLMAYVDAIKARG
jgi:hypothetical protein